MIILTGTWQFSSSIIKQQLSQSRLLHKTANTVQRHCILLFTTLSKIVEAEDVRPTGYIVSCIIS